MPKKKTRRAASKRFKVTKSGKVMRRHAKMRHLLACKSPKARRHLRQSVAVSPADVHRIRSMLTAGGR